MFQTLKKMEKEEQEEEIQESIKKEARMKRMTEILKRGLDIEDFDIVNLDETNPPASQIVKETKETEMSPRL